VVFVFWFVFVTLRVRYDVFAFFDGKGAFFKITDKQLLSSVAAAADLIVRLAV